MSFKDYKTARKSAMNEILEEAEKLTKTSQKFEADPDDWYPTVDKAGNAVVIVRFMPGKEDEKVNFVRWWHHNFKNEQTGRWYIENSRSIYGFDTDEGRDPCIEYNNKLWNSTKDDDHPNRKQASRQGRNINFRSNIYVIGDSHKPECNGTLKKWKYGMGVFNALMKAMKPPVVEGVPQDEDEVINPFDLIDGSNLKIVITTDPTKKMANGRPVRNYEFKWMKAGPLGEEKLVEKLYNEIQDNPKWSLTQYVAPEKFKTYEELRKRLTFVMGYDPLEENRREEPKVAPRLEMPKMAKSAPVPQSDDEFLNSLKDDDEQDDIPF